MTKAATAAANTATDDTDDEKRALFGGMTDEQRDQMTDEELAGIDGDEDGDDDDGEDGDTGTDESADGKSDEGDADGDDAGEEGDDGEGEDGDDAGEEGEGAGEGDDSGADAGAEAAGEDAGEDEGEEDEGEDALDITRSVLPNEWQVPKDADEQLKAFDQQATDLADKFDAGDLTAREYHEQSRALEDQRSDLRGQINDAKKAWGKAMGDWSSRTVPGFLREHKEYDAKANPTLNRMLDAEVRALQVETNDPFNPRILRRAHENIQKAMGKTTAAPAGEQPNAQAAAKTGKNAKAKTPVVPGKKPQVPPTLARVPQDEIDDAEGGKYARLDRLSARDPHAFEEALAKMSPHDRDEYLAGA